MLEHHQRAGRHFAARGSPVVIKHVGECLPQQGQVGLGEPRALLLVIGEPPGDEAVRAIQAIRHDVLAPHGPVVQQRIPLVGDGGAGDGDLHRHDRPGAFGEGELHRAAHLPGIHLGGHHGAKGADVEEVDGRAEYGRSTPSLLICNLIGRYKTASFAVARAFLTKSLPAPAAVPRPIHDRSE